MRKIAPESEREPCFGWLIGAFRRLRFFCVPSALLFSLLPGRADSVTDWNRLMIDAIRADNSAPTLSSRNLAILDCAIYDAVNSIERTCQPCKFLLEAPAGASPEAAAAAAGFEVLKSLYPPFNARSRALYQNYTTNSAATAALADGLALGTKIGVLVLKSRETDGANAEVPYIPHAEPGQWRRTPPFFRPPVTAHWRYLKPFCIPELDRFLPPPPPSLGSTEYAAAINELKAIGGKSSPSRTPEQTQIATFWSDFSYTAMPPGHWHEIAINVAETRGNTLAEKARLFALLSLAQADAAIVCWEAKYRHNFWRPVTAIQRADADGNPATAADPGWQSFLVTPPFPSYTSGHSSFSAASAEVLARFFGTDRISFVAHSDSLPEVVRRFDSFSGCADEVGISRIYGGIHYNFDNVEGKKSGKLVGQYVAANFLLPNDSLPKIVIDGEKDGIQRLRLHGHIGRDCVLESSLDSKQWTAVSTNVAVPGGIEIPSQTVLANSSRVFHVREAP